MIALLLAVPFVFSVSPSSAPAGAAGAVVAVEGRGFTPQAVGLWNGRPRPTFYVSGGELRVELRPSDLIAAEPGFISVYDRGSRAASAGARFEITSPAPATAQARARPLLLAPPDDERPPSAPAATPAVYQPQRASPAAPARDGSVPGKASL